MLQAELILHPDYQQYKYRHIIILTLNCNMQSVIHE